MTSGVFRLFKTHLTLVSAQPLRSLDTHCVLNPLMTSAVKQPIKVAITIWMKVRTLGIEVHLNKPSNISADE